MNQTQVDEFFVDGNGIRYLSLKMEEAKEVKKLTRLDGEVLNKNIYLLLVDGIRYLLL